jgi:hypothetical protein
MILKHYSCFRLLLRKTRLSRDVCRKAGPDIAGKTEFVTVKKV